MESATSFDAYVQHRSRTGRVLWAGGIPWYSADHLLRPLALPHRMRPVPTDEVRAILRSSGAIAALWTDAWDTSPTGFWWTCCDRRDYDIAALTKYPRRDIRKGLEACEIRRLDHTWFAEHGYPVYAASFRKRGLAPPMASEQFSRNVHMNAEYAGRETWGAFINGELVAWESCLVIDDVAMSSAAKSDPDYHKACPNSALVYTLTRHYLRDRGCAYVTAGARVLFHDTNIQQFQEKLGYRKVYCPLRIEFSLLGRAAMGLKAHRILRWIGAARLKPHAVRALEGLALARRLAHEEGAAGLHAAPPDGGESSASET